MIVDKIENAHLYGSISKRLAKGFKLLKDGLEAKESGRYDVDGGGLYYMIQRYETKPVEEGRVESHRKYIDIQFIAEGEEMIGYMPIDTLKVEIPFDAETDVAFYKPRVEDMMKVRLKAGMFCVLFPDDAHMSCRQLNGASDVTKIMVKVKI